MSDSVRPRFRLLGRSNLSPYLCSYNYSHWCLLFPIYMSILMPHKCLFLHLQIKIRHQVKVIFCKKHSHNYIKTCDKTFILLAKFDGGKSNYLNDCHRWRVERRQNNRFNASFCQKFHTKNFTISAFARLSVPRELPHTNATDLKLMKLSHERQPFHKINSERANHQALRLGTLKIQKQVLQIEHKLVMNLNCWEADQLAICKRGRGIGTRDLATCYRF